MSFNDPALLELLKGWEESLHGGRFTKTLRAYWRQTVPLVLSPGEQAVNPTYDEELIRQKLFYPLEAFVCGGEPSEVFRQLKSLDEPPQICGKVFKMGEPTYSCRDCCVDPTCVLCIECFQKSVHKKHRYRISTSGGGGYCDCGDEEAWKSDPYCDSHSVGGTAAGRVQNPLEQLPTDLRERADAVLLCIVPYMLQQICWQDCNVVAEDLRPSETRDTYCCMLYNDEVHTYEQVIKILGRAVDCTQKEAVDFATTVDREGRTSVMNASYSHCKSVGQLIGRTIPGRDSQPLKVFIMHSSVVAHQNFAVRLLTWTAQIVGCSDGIRQLFNNMLMAGIFSLRSKTDFGVPELEKLSVFEVLMLDPSTAAETLSFLDLFLLADTLLWKSVRVHCHKLFMSSCLMDQDSKRNFAMIFAKNYPKLIEAFINDDHEHNMSCTSLSVQIFTIPTLARSLIQEQNLLALILNEFYKQCLDYKVSGKLAFDRNGKYSKLLNRAAFMLYDVKYLLICQPDSWNAKLKENFLNGFRVLLELISCMQGMDAVTRQVGQHIEYEPEWETAFTLHLKIAMNISLIIGWCSSDKEVLTEAYKLALNTLWSIQGRFQQTKKEVEGHSVLCVDYDVVSQPVSIHLPVSRLLASLYISLGKFDLTDQSPELRIANRPTPQEMLEYPLRCQVMVAQSYAGMWRRNGYSLLHQIYLYHDSRFRGEMMDRDIQMMQIAASSVPANDFIVMLMDRFHLLVWIKSAYEGHPPPAQEDTLRQTVALVEEFLQLLLVIIGERYVPGIGKVTPADCLRREIVHQLCIGPMAHSELTKSLPENNHYETGLEEVINDVACFKKPQGSVKGMYELKQDWYKLYNPFFFHYTRSDQSKSEETQRKRQKTNSEEEGSPPPVPPPFTTEFENINELLHCDIMLLIMQTVLSRATMRLARSFSEPQLHRVLHLVGLALQEEKRQIEEKEEYRISFVRRALEKDVFKLLEQLVDHAHGKAHSQLLAWVIRMFNHVSKLQSTEFQSLDVIQLGSEVQKKTQACESEQKQRAKLAAQRRQKILAQMSAMQKNFIKENKELFDNTHTELTPVSSEVDMSNMDVQVDFPIAIGIHKTNPTISSEQGICILCQETTNIKPDGPAMVLAAYVQKSTVMSKSCRRATHERMEYNPLFMPADLACGTHTGTCGHVMHAECWQKYFDSIVAKERRRPLRLRHQLCFEVDKNEFLCPLCENLSNTVIPLLPPLSVLASYSTETSELNMSDWLDVLDKTIVSCRTVKHTTESTDTPGEEFDLFVPDTLSAVCKLLKDSVADNVRQLFHYVLDAEAARNWELSKNIVDMLQIYAQAAYTIGLDALPHRDNPRVPVAVWSTCAFTIQSLEWHLRNERKPLLGAFSMRHGDCLSAVVRTGAVISHIVDLDILKSHCIQLLSILGGTGTADDTPCILSIDFFSYLVSVVFALPALYAEGGRQSLKSVPCGRINEKSILHLAFLAHIVQTIVVQASSQVSTVDRMEVNPTFLKPPKQITYSSEKEARDGIVLQELYATVCAVCGIKPTMVPTGVELVRQVKSACCPFLRTAAIFFHFLTNVQAPKLLTEVSSSEFETISAYLSLPQSFTKLLEDRNLVNSLVTKWCGHPRIAAVLKGAGSSSFVEYPLSVSQLVSLPHDYSELINQAAVFTCPNSDRDDSRVPTMCLICGEMLCSQSYCCQAEIDKTPVGACTYHAHSCGASIGIFLMVRQCQVLLLSGRTKGCFYPPPYLDSYGETDRLLRRGNPLHLDEQRYKKLHSIWLQHRIPQEIAHCIESNANLLSYDWQHF